jgi:hypothetical protein
VYEPAYALRRLARLQSSGFLFSVPPSTYVC